MIFRSKIDPLKGLPTKFEALCYPTAEQNHKHVMPLP